MFIEVEDLKDEPFVLHHEYAPQELPFQHDLAVLEGPVILDLVLTHKERDLHFTGSITTELRHTCSRCLTQFRSPLKAGFDVSYAPHPRTTDPEEEIELRYEDMDVGFYDGIRLDLDLMVAEQIDLNIPMRTICREDCKGLCPKCGVDHNLATCTCAEDSADSRMAALLEFRRKMGRH